MQNEGGFFVIINYSATTLSVGSLEVSGWVSSFLQSSRILLPHSTQVVKQQISPDKHTNLSQQKLSIHGFKQVQRAVMWLGEGIP